MEIVSLKSAAPLLDPAFPGPPLSRRGTHDALRAGFSGLKQPTFYIYEMVIPVCRRLYVKESKWTEPTVQVWPHNVFLCKYLEMQAAREGPKYFADKTVLELGAGCGLTGMVAAMLGASVTVVEGESLLPHLRHNVDAFSAEWKGELQIQCKEEGAALGQLRSRDNETKNPLFDIIICSDVSTAKELPYSFLLTLLKLMGERSEVLLCHTRSCSLDAPAPAAETAQGRFMTRLLEIFEVEEEESEDTIRAFCEQLTGGVQLLRSQSTIDIQECSDAEGRLVVLRLRCSQEIEGLKKYVDKQLKKEAAPQHERDTLIAKVHTVPTTAAPESVLLEKDSVPVKTTAEEPPTTADCFLNETEGAICKDVHTSATSVRRSSHKRTFSGARDPRQTETTTARWVRSRVLRPRVTAGTRRESSPSTGGTPFRTRTGSSSVVPGGRAPSAERYANADDAQRTALDARLSPSMTQPSASHSRSVAASKKDTEQVYEPRAPFTQDTSASPAHKKPAEKVQPVLPVGDKNRAPPGSPVRLSASSSTTRTQLSSHPSKASMQGSPSSGIRSRMLSITSKDKGGISSIAKRGKIESMSSLRTKAPSSTISVEAQGQQAQSRSSTMTTNARSTESGPTPSPCSPPYRALPSSVNPSHRPLPDGSRLVSRRGQSAAPKGTAAQLPAPTAPPKNPARPSSTVEPGHTLNSASKMLRSIHAHTDLQRPTTSKKTSTENRNQSPTTLPRTQHCQQRSGDAAGVGGALKGTFASSRSSVKSRAALNSDQCDSASPDKGVIRGVSSTLYRTGGSPHRRQEKS